MALQQALSLVENVEPVRVRLFTLRLRDRTEYVSECKIDVEWIVFHGHLETSFENHLLEVGLTHPKKKNRKTMALRTLTTVGLFDFIKRKEGPA